MLVMLLEMLLAAVTNGFHVYFVLFLSFLAAVVYLSYRLLRFPKPGPYVVKGFLRKNATSRDSPIIIAHRGGSIEAPENTLAAFRKAKENGASAVEFDLDFTQDGVPVIIHDSSVNRTTDGTGDISELRYEEVQRLNASANHRLRDEFPNETIPTLEEAINTCLDLGLQMFIDVKTFTGVQKVADVLKELFHRYQLYDKAIVCSFYPNVIFQVRRTDPNILTALTWRKFYISKVMSGGPRFKELWKQIVAPVLDRLWEIHLHSWVFEFLGVTVFLVNKDSVSKWYMKQFKERGINLVLWTVNNPAEKDFFTNYLKLPIMTDCVCRDSLFEDAVN